MQPNDMQPIAHIVNMAWGALHAVTLAAVYRLGVAIRARPASVSNR